MMEAAAAGRRCVEQAHEARLQIDAEARANEDRIDPEYIEGDPTPILDGVYPTPQQLVYQMLQEGPDWREQFAIRALDNGEADIRCFEQDHAGQEAQLVHLRASEARKHMALTEIARLTSTVDGESAGSPWMKTLGDIALGALVKQP
jgi:hypothetical protein